MGSVANATKNLGNRFGKGVTKTSSIKQGGNLSRNFSSNIGISSKYCPVINECRNIGEGLTLGDFKKTTDNGAILIVSALPFGGAGKVGFSQKGMMAQKAATLAIANQALNRNFSSDTAVDIQAVDEASLKHTITELWSRVPHLEGVPDNEKVRESVVEKFNHLGALNLQKLMDEGKIQFAKYDTGAEQTFVEVAANQIQEDKRENLKFSYTGQYDPVTKQAHGLGRSIHSDCYYTQIYDGQFVQGKMCGFGRIIDNAGTYHTGWFKYDQRHGFGIYFDPAGDMQDGYFWEDEFVGWNDKDGVFKDDKLVSDEFDGHAYHTNLDDK